MRFGIVYALTKADADEKISLGIVYIDAEKPYFRLSEEKLGVALQLLSEKAGECLKLILAGIPERLLEGKSPDSIASRIGYYNVYCNNLIGFSPVRQDSVSSEEAIFCRYVI